MEKQAIPTNEMDYLLAKGKELTIQGLLTDEIKEMIYFGAEKGVMTFGESLEKSFKKDMTVQMTDYEISNGRDFLSARQINLLTVFLFKVMDHPGNHVLMMTQEACINFYQYVTKEVVEEHLNQNQLDFLATHFSNGLKNFYKRFSEEIKVSFEIQSVLATHLNMESDSLENYSLDHLNEIKVYELLTDADKFNLVHLSDLDFMEYTYSQIQVPHEEFFVEDLIETQPLSYESPFITEHHDHIMKPQFANFSEENFDQGKHNLGLLYDVPLELSVVLGKTKMPVKDVLELNTGKIIELNKYADDPLEIYANGKLIAEGEVVVIDENFGVRVTKLYQNEFQTNPSKR